MKLLATFLLAVLLCIAPGGPAFARDATRDEVAALAHDAVIDDRARARLEEIDSIDGTPIDVERLIAGAEGAEVEERIGTLLATEGPAPEGPEGPESVRADAESILEQDRFQPQEIPRPFRGPLEWIADRLEPVGNGIDAFFGWFADLFSRIAGATPGGAATLWTIIGLVVVVVVLTQTRRIIERRGRSRAATESSGSFDRGDDPRDLERRAAVARERGDHALEVRLLFRAGVLRLARARAIPPRRSLTTGDIRRLLASNDFDSLGRSFDEIAYGRRPATESDGRAARAGWSRVLQGVDR